MKILLTGDSIIARHEGLSEPRINVDLKKKVPGIKLINTAISGINSGAFFAMLSELVLKPEKCDNLVILLGTNDLPTHKQVPMEQFKKNMELIASSVICKYYPPHVILLSPPAVDEQKQRVRNNRIVASYAKRIEEVAKEYGLRYVNLYQAMLNHGDLTNLCRGVKNDGLHFGAAGYELLSDLLINELKQIS